MSPLVRTPPGRNLTLRIYISGRPVGFSLPLHRRDWLSSTTCERERGSSATAGLVSCSPPSRPRIRACVSRRASGIEPMSSLLWIGGRSSRNSSLELGLPPWPCPPHRRSSVGRHLWWETPNCIWFVSNCTLARRIRLWGRDLADWCSRPCPRRRGGPSAAVPGWSWEETRWPSDLVATAVIRSRVTIR
jgi:hypothetical protein